ncbi:MAG: NADPH:quinone oxidoreductase family protein [Microscillaceae bacterium]|nr:NADPH:quinone oxidoreductase family protein [Microscillaceae bacterium]
MKAIICKNWGIEQTRTFEEIAPPNIEAHEVLLDVKAVSLSLTDVLIMEGRFSPSPPFPFIPGREVAGLVRACGSAVKNFKIGDSVVAWVEKGGLAELVKAPENQVFSISDRMSFGVGAGFLVPYTLAYLGLTQRAKLQVGDTVLVHGAGSSMGLAAVDLARYLGGKVIASASTPQKLSIAQQRGAEFLINYQLDDFNDKIREYTQGKGAKIMFDLLGGEKFDPLFRHLATEGHWLAVGFATGRIPQLTINRLLFRNASLHTLWWFSYLFNNPHLVRRAFQELNRSYHQGLLRVEVAENQVFKFENTYEALQMIQNRQSIGKVIIEL